MNLIPFLITVQNKIDGKIKADIFRVDAGSKEEAIKIASEHGQVICISKLNL